MSSFAFEAISLTCLINPSFSFPVKLEALLMLLILASASRLTASLASCLTWESSGTVTASIAATPSLPAWVAPSLVVAA